jgi:hypothetical protein
MGDIAEGTMSILPDKKSLGTYVGNIFVEPFLILRIIRDTGPRKPIWGAKRDFETSYEYGLVFLPRFLPRVTVWARFDPRADIFPFRG